MIEVSAIGLFAIGFVAGVLSSALAMAALLVAAAWRHRKGAQ